MEERVRRILIELNRGASELEELVDEGKQVIDKIEVAGKGEQLGPTEQFAF